MSSRSSQSRSQSRGSADVEYINPTARRQFGNYMSAKISSEWGNLGYDGQSSYESINPEAEEEFFNRASQEWSTTSYDGSDGSSEEYLNPQAEERFFGGYSQPHGGRAHHVVTHGPYDGTVPIQIGRSRRSEYNPKDYFKPGVPLNDLQKKYCRCTAHVRAGQPKWCLQEHAWFQRRDNQTCYNPYPVCKDSTGFRENVECSQYFNFNAFPDKELIAYALERLLPIPQPYNREALIQRLEDYAEAPEFSRSEYEEPQLNRSID
jgi:hypothetical protein